MLTVVQTLRLQNRPVLDYMHRAIVAHRAGLFAPQLLGHAGGRLNGYDAFFQHPLRLFDVEHVDFREFCANPVVLGLGDRLRT